MNPRTLTRKEITPAIGELDLFVLGGGGILFDGEAEAYLREVLIAREAKVPVVVYAVSAGPLATPASRRAVRDALDGSAGMVITVRDRMGVRLLEDVGVTQDVHLAADPAFLLEPEELPAAVLTAEGVDLDRHLIGFSVREPGPAAPDIDPDQYYGLLANAADFLVERFDAEVVFVPMEKFDVQHSHAVIAHMRFPERAELIRRRYSARQLLDLMGRFSPPCKARRSRRSPMLPRSAGCWRICKWTPRHSAALASASSLSASIAIGGSERDSPTKPSWACCSAERSKLYAQPTPCRSFAHGSTKARRARTLGLIRS